MKAAVIYLIFLAGISLLSSCKTGCKEPSALNYNPKAKINDAYSCMFFADSLVGNYTAQDSSVRILNDTFQYSAGQIRFSIYRELYDKIRVDGFFSSYQIWQVDSTPFIVNDSIYSSPNVMFGKFNFHNDTLYYNTILSNNSGVFQKHWGYGVRQ